MYMRYRSDFFIAIFLLVLPLILFWPVTAGKRTLLPTDNLIAFEPWKSAGAEFDFTPPPHNSLLSDLILQNYLWKKFIRESFQARELPLWNPYLFAGSPFLATGQHSALYPFSLIYYLFPLPRAYGLFTVTQFFIAGLFAYIFLRVLGLNRLGATFGAVVYEMSLFMVVSVVFPMIIAGVAWLPLILASLELIARRRTALGGRSATAMWVILGGGALGCQILAGHIEITYYTLMIAGTYSAWRLFCLYLDFRNRQIRERDQYLFAALSAAQTVARCGAAMLAVGFLGLMLGAIQFVPLFELAQTSFRTGRATFDEVISWSYPWRHMLLFLVPNLYGNPGHHIYFDLFTWQWLPATVNSLGESISTLDWGQAPFKNYVEGGTYLGLLPLLLTPLSLAQWGRWAWARFCHKDEFLIPMDSGFSSNLIIPFFALLAFFALAFIFPTRLYAIIYWLPGINQLHSPFRWVWPLALSIAVLSAYGIEYLQQNRKLFSKQPSQPPFLAQLFCLWAPSSLPMFLSGTATWGGIAILFVLSIIRIDYTLFAGLMKQIVTQTTYATHMFADGQMFFSYTAYWVFVFALMLIASGIILRLSQSQIRWGGRPVWEFLAVSVISLDLLVAGWGFNSSSDPRILDYVPPSAQFLQQDTSLWRFTTYDPKGTKPYNANIGWYFNFEDIRGYDSLFTRQYADYMNLIEPQYELLYNRIAPIREVIALNSPLLDLLNVKYVITNESIFNSNYTVVYSGEVKIYRNKTVMPRAFVLPQTATLAVDDLTTAMQQFDPREYVMVAPEDALGIEFALPAQPIPALEVQHTSNEVLVMVKTTTPSWLILTDAFSPGWKAFLSPREATDVPDKEVKIVQAYGLFRAVVLPQGEWIVRFKYMPIAVWLGGGVTFVAGIILLLILGVWLNRSFRMKAIKV